MTKNKIFIVEGENAVGKSSLLTRLTKDDRINPVYAVPDLYTNIRKKAYQDISDKASLMLYLSANIEVFEKLKNKDINILDRSFISSFAMYFSRIDEQFWNSYLYFFDEFLKLTPKIEKIYFLKVDDKIRQERIQKKHCKEDIENDLNENQFEMKKNKARELLIKRLNCDSLTIDTSHLSENKVFKIVYEDILLKI